MTSSLDETKLVPAPDTALQATILPAERLARLRASGKDLAVSRRPSLVASLDAADGPLPDRYAEGRLLGKGGMGVVVLAHDRDLARSVAVKKLRDDGANVELLDRFVREAQVTAQLEHPGVLPVHDLGIDEKGQFFYVMRLVRGDETLRRVIDRLEAGDPATHAAFPFERRVQVIQKVADILHYAHTKGVVHRDVKPENIMLGSFGEVYLVDWGLAKVAAAPELPSLPAEQAPPTVASASVTHAGRLMGTPLYMSPEQSRGEPATALSDVYSLSVVLYELLANAHPLGEPESFVELLRKIQFAEPTPAEDHWSEKNGYVPRHLSLICQRGLAKDPAARYESAGALHRALQGFLEGDVPVVCPTTLALRLTTIYRRAAYRRPVLIGFTTVVLPILALLAGVVWAIVHALR